MNSIGQIRILETEDNIVKSELLRLTAFNVDLQDFDVSNSYYYMGIKNNLFIPFGLFIKGQLVAGCYVSNFNDSLYIDQLFVNPIFHNTGLRFGRMILRYILNNKKQLEEIFERKLTTSTIEPLNEKCRAIYAKEGYELQDEIMVKAI